MDRFEADVFTFEESEAHNWVNSLLIDTAARDLRKKQLINVQQMDLFEADVFTFEESEAHNWVNSLLIDIAARDLRKKQLILGREGFEKEDWLPWERERFCG
jgi:phage protein D